MKTQNKLFTILWFSLACIATLGTVLYALKGHLIPVIGATVFIYLTQPIQNLLKNSGLSNRSSALIISLTLFAIICFVLLQGLPILASDLTWIIKQLPSSIETTYNHINTLLEPYDIQISGSDLPSIVKQTLSNKDINALQSIPSIVSSTIRRFIDVVLFFTSFLFLPLFFFFALQHGDYIIDALLSVVPPIIRKDTAEFLTIVHQTMSAWIAGYGSIIIFLCILYSIGFLVLSIPYAITLGIITGLLYIIPAVGPLIALVLTSTITIATYGLNAWHIVQVILLFSTLQIIEGFILSPFFIGNKLGLNLPLLLFSILVGGGLFGGAGIVLSVPIASIIKKVILLMKQKQSSDWIYDN
ncbi:AI-2E family transporter [Candidatus Synchoanobacter obligatus]|uniref:AI-2E family transporter n=1 Tax=Candidatus Synchoanobacter obligatus TaxID=2919597 RepID=A0ABT1L4J6_9GAMM|nr:AI-2E family transporter [Candidatus Synchoanobacter obligatus]MCP8352076.1 AI-2E family transporter [Candidatus Synchoanobacter obligatus]